MRQFLTPKLVLLASRRRALLRLLALRDCGALVVVGRIELGAVGAPGRILQRAVDLAQPGRWKPQCDALSDAHHDVPTHDLDPVRRKRLVITMLLELRVALAQWMRLVVL